MTPSFSSRQSEIGDLSPLPEKHRSQMVEFLLRAGIDAQGLRVEAIQPEASARRYYRLHTDVTRILCHDPVGLAEGESSDFCQIATHLQKHSIPVPQILAIEAGAGLLLISDVGSTDLLAAEHSQPTEALTWLHEAVDLLVRLHAVPAVPPISTRFFDKDKFLFEIRYLEQALQFVEEQHALPTPFLSPELRFFLRSLCERLAQSNEWVLTHRDYHGRNILVSSAGELSLVDFQDARMGSPWYDLSSLLFDPYCAASRTRVFSGLARYTERSGRSPGDNANVFYAQALQRVFKALGNYLQLTFQAGMGHVYARSIPAALDQLELATQLGGFPDSVFLFIGDARRRLLPLVPKQNAIGGAASGTIP